MDLETEIKLLKEKVELLEKVKELQGIIRANDKIGVPVVPYDPNPYPFIPTPWYWTTWTISSAK